MKLEYRPDIDGLRALAVVPVLLFHFGFEQLPGGFVGVDVFFVISGFLITGLIHREILEGSFSISQFYERRVRRILPALAAVVIATAAVAYFMFMPQTYKDFGQSLAALGVFSSNLMFYLESGYFDSGSISKPLLHTWSLSVEEQYYIVMPLILLLVHKLTKSRFLFTLAVLAAISLFISLRTTAGNSGFAFYMPITRAWELLAGAIIAIHLARHKPQAKYCSTLSGIGFVLLILSYLFISEEQPFPGVAAIWPVMATVLLIYGGSLQDNPVNRLFTSRAIIHVGKISYSLYLVHWPLLVFWVYYFGEDIDLFVCSVLLLSSFALAHASWRYVETPFRDKSWISSRAVFASSFVLLVSFILVGVFINMQNGIPGRLPAQVRLAAEFEENTYRDQCHQKSDTQIESEDYCTLGNQVQPSIALIGDSHADALSTSVVRAATQSGNSVAVFTRGGCRPFNTSTPIERQCGHFEDEDFIAANCPVRAMQQCTAFNTAAFNEVERLDVDLVILSARWASQFYGTGAKTYDYCYTTENFSECSQQNNQRVFEELFYETLSSLQHVRRVLVLGPTPEYFQSIPESAGKAELFGSSFVNSDPEFTERGMETLGLMKDIAEQFPNTEVVDFYPLLCPDEACIFLKDGKTLYADAHHLSVFGNEYLLPLVSKSIADSLPQ